MSKPKPQNDWDREAEEMRAKALKNTRLVLAAPDGLAFAEKFLSKLLYAPDGQVVMKFEDLAQLKEEAQAYVTKTTGGDE